MMLHNNLLPCLQRLAQLQNVPADRHVLQEAVESTTVSDTKAQLDGVARHLHLKSVKWLKKPDPAQMPLLACSPTGEWGLVRGLNAQNQWISEWWDAEAHQWNEQTSDGITDHKLAVINLSRPFSASNSQVYRLIRDELFSHKRLILEGVVAGVVINTVALGGSFYTMQVYDRVVPTGATQTLLVLSLGVFIAILYELFTKHARTRLYDKLVDRVDQRLARSVYMRFLNIRLDQMPRSVGSLASQMRGYETVRSFLSAVLSRLLIDAPFALVYVAIIAAIAGLIALIPLTFFVLSICIGCYYRRRVDALAVNANAASNFKTGLLVESVEGAETIKSGQGGWRMLSRWMNTTDEARGYEAKMRNVNEHSQHLTAAFQQLSYISLVASGAMLITAGELSMGGLIACSILSGRILAPVASIPALLVQWGHTKAALKGLDGLWALQDDHHDQDQPVVLETIRGNYQFEEVSAQYGENRALQVPGLIIKDGEKVGVLGPVGSGKTTLLRLLSGMYKPQSGRILLDNVDLAHIAKPVFAEHVGFVQQEGRLFAGTLRENLTLGLLDPGDEAILETSRITGLMESVIAPNPKGLQQEIYEGGTGLSGGQRQLVNLTRVFLRKPSIWLLDEPSASMDRNLELKVLGALGRELKSDHTLVLVTHKPEMLKLVDRLIVISNNCVVMDGPKDKVLNQLQTPVRTAEQIT